METTNYFKVVRRSNEANRRVDTIEHFEFFNDWNARSVRGALRCAMRALDHFSDARIVRFKDPEVRPRFTPEEQAAWDCMGVVGVSDDFAPLLSLAVPANPIPGLELPIIPDCWSTRGVVEVEGTFDSPDDEQAVADAARDIELSEKADGGPVD